MTYWEQMKHPENYENNDKYPFTPMDIRVAGEEPKEKKPTAKELVPEEYHEFINVFEKKASERMPLRKPWDHAIDLKPDFVPKKGKIIQLSQDEQKEVQDFLDDQLEKDT